MTEFVNPETGEIESVPEGHDDLAWLATQFHEANEQEKAWLARKRWLASVLMAKQDAKSAVYDNRLRISRVRGGTYEKQDTEGFLKELEGIELRRDELVAIVQAGKSFGPVDDENMEKLRKKYTQCLKRADHMESTIVRKVLGRENQS